jgi:hypothetical protein
MFISWRTERCGLLQIKKPDPGGLTSVSDPDPHSICLLDPNADPDPAADKISSKSQNNSCHLELFD